ncbi:MAG: NAD(P)H-binding protein [Terriglobus roseus]|nr:NAD(P)H-binding protein [Terriglobus roseus]
MPMLIYAIKRLAGPDAKGKLDVLVSSVEDVQTNEQARKVVDEVSPDWIVWSAGAGGRGGPDRTRAVDEVACKRFVHAAFHSPGVTKFLLVSYPGSREQKPAWWSDESWKESRRANEEVLPAYAKAKIAADRYFASAFLAAKDGKRPGGKEFVAIDLRPGTLTEEPAGKVSLGKTEKSGKVSRASVADVAARLLESGYKGGWVDLSNGDEDPAAAVKRVVAEGVDTLEGEDLGQIRPLFGKE